mgnify:CR=1 FL=1
MFLGVCLLGSLMLRTQMVQNSFEASQIETHITQLTQDVEDDQAKLDELDASLPSKAEEMGMVPQKGALTIDLNGYQANVKWRQDPVNPIRRIYTFFHKNLLTKTMPSASFWR